MDVKFGSMTIIVPEPTEDQKKYLEDIEARQRHTDYVVAHCTCRWGGRPGSYAESRKTCPIHKDKP